MIRFVKNALRLALAYTPLRETSSILAIVDDIRSAGLPTCPPYEGDLIFSLIRQNDYRSCLETGFHTGSTALYMAAALGANGRVTSIAVDPDDLVNRGLTLLRRANLIERHTLLRENSNTVLPKMFVNGDTYDFIYMDGWKTFDHLAFEIYFLNQMLKIGGTFVFDDTQMPSVERAIGILVKYYGYEEVDYSRHNQSLRLRVFHILTRRSFKRPYRGFKKVLDVKDQAPFKDYTFYRKI
jgi:predicted O-methyltransferase YrrM